MTLVIQKTRGKWKLRVLVIGAGLQKWMCETKCCDQFKGRMHINRKKVHKQKIFQSYLFIVLNLNRKNALNAMLVF